MSRFTSGGDQYLVNRAVGQTRSYSTGAFTLLGSVLVQRTQRKVSRMVEEEIADQYGLDTLRSMYRSSILRPNPERSKLYRLDDDGSIEEADYRNNSWKVLGGGIESNVVDLALFGWKVLDGEIVDAQTRDCRMWMRVGAASNYGLAWRLGIDVDDRRVAEHGGDALGMDALLRIYRDHGLVIAILANRNITPNTRSSLANSIANIVVRSGAAEARDTQCP